MRAFRIATVIIVLALLIIGLASAQQPDLEQKPAGAIPPRAFDHSNCQYPDRWSNPPQGCDNSDPAVPECIKAFSTKEGEEACIRAFVKANDPTAAEPIFPEPTYTEGK